MLVYKLGASLEAVCLMGVFANLVKDLAAWRRRAWRWRHRRRRQRVGHDQRGDVRVRSSNSILYDAERVSAWRLQRDGNALERVE